MGKRQFIGRVEKLIPALALSLTAVGCSTFEREPGPEQDATASEEIIKDRETGHNSRIVNRENQDFLKR